MVVQIAMRSATRLKKDRDPAYLKWLHGEPCFICYLFRLEQNGRTEAAHVGDRGLSQKCPDSQALPCCAWHHRTGPESLHRLGGKFWQRWGLDKAELITAYRKKYEEEKAAHATE